MEWPGNWGRALTAPISQDILACVGGVQLIFPLLESIGPLPDLHPAAPAQLKPPYLRSHYTSDCSVGIHEGFSH